MDYESVTSVLRAFEEHGVRYVVFGGAALNLHGLTRFTEDLDVFIEPTTENVERMKVALVEVFADPEIASITAADLLGDYPAIQYVPPVSAFHLDVLTRLGDAFRFEDLEAERVPLADFEVTVVTPRMLHRMKRGTVRPRDRADAAALAARFDVDDE